MALTVQHKASVILYASGHSNSSEKPMIELDSPIHFPIASGSKARLSGCIDYITYIYGHLLISSFSISHFLSCSLVISGVATGMGSPEGFTFMPVSSSFSCLISSWYSLRSASFGSSLIFGLFLMFLARLA